MKCLLRYQWVKLPRNRLPEGKGIMGMWARLAARAAFRKGEALYCGHKNAVSPGMWSGGVVGLKSILGVQTRSSVLQTMDELCRLGYVKYSLDRKTKKLTYQLCDWVVKCSGAECMDGAVYVTEGYGFLCLPRNITDTLEKENRVFEEADAWLDLWCHTVSEDRGNAFSYLAPSVQYGKYGAALTLETLGRRWGWEKTKVWRFFKKHGDVFPLYRLPGSYGCLVFNTCYPTGSEVSPPDQADILRIFSAIRTEAGNAYMTGSDRESLNRMIAWYSKRLVPDDGLQAGGMETESRVALSDPLIRAYLSPCWNCKNGWNCRYDCGSVSMRISVDSSMGSNIRGPCRDGPQIQKTGEYPHGR